jgi:hypothetical protein
MASSTAKQPLTYLRDARLQAGYTNRGTASTVVPYSPEEIGRHERGEVDVGPEGALVYSRGYQREDISRRYCADCPIGKENGWHVTDRDFPTAVLRFARQYKRAADIPDTLEDIAYDGIVDEAERPVFADLMKRLMELIGTFSDLELHRATQGIKIEPPSETHERPNPASILAPSSLPVNDNFFKEAK